MKRGVRPLTGALLLGAAGCSSRHDAAAVLPGGAAVLPEGAAVLPEGAAVLPEGAAMLPGGALLPAGRADARADAGATRQALRGVCWNPVGVGDTHPEGLAYAHFSDIDIPLMAQLGVNVVRTYEPLLDRAVLDRLWDAGIRVIQSVYPYGGADVSVVTARVRAVKDHPAVLYWALGNEWNYNGLYVGLSFEASLARLNEVAALVRAEDAAHPIATIHGELPAPETIAAMPDIDVWGVNSYRGLSFGDLFEEWRARSEKPLFVAEYGADAYNMTLPGYDPESQAVAVAALTREILEQATQPGADGAPVLGGTLFEWADEWWKDPSGSLSAQDIGGIAPGVGPHPDLVFNEEWWGLVDMQRNPRPAFEQLRAVFDDFER